MTAQQDPVSLQPEGGALLNVVVIGSGQAGLAMAWPLAQQELRAARRRTNWTRR